MHMQPNPLHITAVGPRAIACSFAHTKTRLEATLPFCTLEMQLQFSLHAGLFTSGGMLPSAKVHEYARSIHSHALPCIRHAHAHMHALHNVHMRVPYGTESLPKRASLMQHCMVAASRVDPMA